LKGCKVYWLTMMSHARMLLLCLLECRSVQLIPA
jgi:hypothetical protein